MEPYEHRPGEPASRSGQYEELNVFGSRTGRMAHVEEGKELPGARAASLGGMLCRSAVKGGGFPAKWILTVGVKRAPDTADGWRQRAARSRRHRIE